MVGCANGDLSGSMPDLTKTRRLVMGMILSTSAIVRTTPCRAFSKLPCGLVKVNPYLTHVKQTMNLICLSQNTDQVCYMLKNGTCVPRVPGYSTLRIHVFREHTERSCNCTCVYL